MFLQSDPTERCLVISLPHLAYTERSARWHHRRLSRLSKARDNRLLLFLTPEMLCGGSHAVGISTTLRSDISGKLLLVVAKYHATLDKHSVFLLHGGTNSPPWFSIGDHSGQLVRSRSVILTSPKILGSYTALSKTSSWNSTTSLMPSHNANYSNSRSRHTRIPLTCRTIYSFRMCNGEKRRRP